MNLQAGFSKYLRVSAGLVTDFSARSKVAMNVKYAISKPSIHAVRIEEVEEGDLPSTTFVRKEVLAIMDKPTKKRKNELLVTAKVNGSALKAHETNDDASMGEQDSEDEDGFALPGKKRGGKATEQTPKKKQAASRFVIQNCVTRLLCSYIRPCDNAKGLAVLIIRAQKRSRGIGPFCASLCG